MLSSEYNTSDDGIRDSSDTQAERVSITNQQTASKDAIKRLADEVCASMPRIGEHDQLVSSFENLKLGETGDLPNIEDSSYPKVMDVPASVLLVASPRASGLFILCYQLQNLSQILDLPKDLKDWINGHLNEIQSITDPNDTRFLHTMLRRQRLDQEPTSASPSIMIKSATK